MSRTRETAELLDDDPLATWDTTWAGLDGAFAGAGLGTIVFASPFLATVPGTDIMVDGIYYWKPDEAALQRIVEQFINGKKLASSG